MRQYHGVSTLDCGVALARSLRGTEGVVVAPERDQLLQNDHRFRGTWFHRVMIVVIETS